MMTGDFGAPIYEEPTHATGDAGPHPGDDAVQDLDPNDPRLTSEPLDANAEGDAYARQPLPPDAKYRAKLKIMKVKDAKQAEHDFLPKMHASQGPYMFTAIDATIQDGTGLYDGIHVYDRWVSTFLQRDKSHKVGTILKSIKQPSGQPWVAAGERMNHKQWLERLVKALAGEPEVGIETEWEWSCQKCGEEAKAKGEKYPRGTQGMRRFPQMAGAKAGVHDPEMRCTVNPAHGFSRAQVRISRIIPVAEVR